MNKKTSSQQKGFTIVELMISSVIFTLILLAATAGIVKIGNIYYKSTISARTQDITRSIEEEISQSIQYTDQDLKVPNYPDSDGDGDPDTVYGPIVSVGDLDTFYFCVGAKRYTFAIDRARSNNPDITEKEQYHALWVDIPVEGCANAVTAPAPAQLSQPQPSDPALGGRELLDEGMRLTSLTISPRGDSNKSWFIKISTAKGKDDLLELSDEGRIVCEGSIAGREFCAISEISTIITKR